MCSMEVFQLDTLPLFYNVTQFWRTILWGTMVKFLFHSLNEPPGSYLSWVKISAWYLEAFQRYGHFTVQTNFYSNVPVLSFFE